MLIEEGPLKVLYRFNLFVSLFLFKKECLFTMRLFSFNFSRNMFKTNRLTGTLVHATYL